MPFEFPNSPANGEYANGFIWNAANQTWDSAIAPRPATVPISSPNYVINGGFDIWQRGTSSTTSGYLADRFQALSDATFTASRQSFSAGTSFAETSIEPSFFHRIAKSSGGTYSTLFQRIESVRTFANKVFTVSFWAKSDVAVTLNIRARQEFGSGGSTSVDIATNTTSLTTSWVRYSFTYTAPSISGKTVGSNDSLLIEMFTLGSGAVTWDVWGVQVEEGAAPTTFRRNAPSIQGELAACQRYLPSVTGNFSYMGYAYTSGNQIYSVPFHVPARVAPTSVTVSSLSNLSVFNNTNASSAPSSFLFNIASTGVASIITVAAGVPIGTPARLETNGGGATLLFNGCEL